MRYNFEKEIEQAISGILHWSYRRLEEFPDELRIYGKFISDIYLKGNAIIKIPKWIGDLQCITELHICENQLTEVPEEISHLKSLRILDISKNQIVALPRSITSLKTLNIFCANDNKIKCLPDDIGKIKALTYLSIKNNLLRSIPNSIVDCISLQEIIFDCNILASLPESMVNLPNISVLSVYGNKFLYFPTAAPTTKPLLIMGKTAFMKCVSYDAFVYILEKEIHRDGPFGINLNVAYLDREDEIIPNSGYKVIVKSRDNSFNKELYLPFPKLYHQDIGVVPNMYEISLRFVYSLLQREKNYYKIRNLATDLKLPRKVGVELCEGPTAYCQTCRCALFQRAILRVFDALFHLQEREVLHVTKFMKVVLYFCSSYCSKSFDFADISKGNPHLPIEFRECEWHQ